MLVSTDQASVGDAHLESSPAATQIGSAGELMRVLASTAQQHKAQLPGEGKPEDLRAVQGLEHSLETVEAQGNGSASGGEGGLGNAVAYADPQLQLSSPSGIAALTPASVVFAAQTSTAIAARHDINAVSQAGSFHAAMAGVGLFTYGKAGNAAKPNKETGLCLHAASGKVSSQSQSGPTRLTAEKTLTVASVTKEVIVTAKKHVLLTARGAYIKLAGGNIEVHGPGMMTFKASMKELTGPAGNTPVLPVLPHHDYRYAQKFQLKDSLGQPLANQAYTVYVSDTQEIRGKTDADGMTSLVDTKSVEQTYIIFDRDLQWICDDEDDDDTDICDC